MTAVGGVDVPPLTLSQCDADMDFPTQRRSKASDVTQHTLRFRNTQMGMPHGPFIGNPHDSRYL